VEHTLNEVRTTLTIGDGNFITPLLARENLTIEALENAPYYGKKNERIRTVSWDKVVLIITLGGIYP